MVRRAPRAAFERLEHRQLLNAVIRVDINSTAAQPDGASWPNAYADLQQALAVASEGTDIWIADGTYFPTSGTDRAIRFDVKDGVSLLGGFAGIGAANPDQRDIAQFVTILSANIGDPNSATDNSYKVLAARGEEFAPVHATVDGLTIRDGYADSPDFGNSGAGMSVVNASATISRCTFAGNTFIGIGGGLVVASQLFSTPPTTISDCIFIGNTGFTEGPFLISGGGLYTSTDVVVERCLFQDNFAPLGGGMYRAGGGLTVRDTTFVRNTAWTGGAILVEGSGATILNSRFHGNSAWFGGGLRVRNISLPDATTLVNCEFVGNRADGDMDQRGGGVYISGAKAVLTNCDVVANSADVASGGIHRASGTLILVNSNLRDNVAPSSPQLNSGTASHSNIRGGFAGTNIIDADAQFVRDPSPGADKTWGTPDDDYGDLRLQITSPNIDAGDNASVPSGVTTDIDGRARFFDFPGVNDGAGAVVDIGAHELDLRLGLLRVDAGQTLNLPAGGHTFYVEQFAFESGATLNVRDDNLIIDYTGPSQLSSVQTVINSARAGGSWTGTGMTSSTARDNPLHNTTLGAIEASDFKSIYGPSALFGGHTFDTTAALVKYTYYGDADFNGIVNFDDYARTDFGFINHRSGWSNGDFDGNGVVNFDDYALIDLAFNTQGSTLGPLAALKSEPSRLSPRA